MIDEQTRRDIEVILQSAEGLVETCREFADTLDVHALQIYEDGMANPNLQEGMYSMGKAAALRDVAAYMRHMFGNERGETFANARQFLEALYALPPNPFTRVQ